MYMGVAWVSSCKLDEQRTYKKDPYYSIWVCLNPYSYRGLMFIKQTHNKEYIKQTHIDLKGSDVHKT